MRTADASPPLPIATKVCHPPRVARVTAAPRGGRHDPHPSLASRSASQPIATPSAKEVYLDSDSDMLLLTTWAGRPAASAAPAYAFARRTPFRPPEQPVSPPSRLDAS